jgi:hypothetical protein
VVVAGTDVSSGALINLAARLGRTGHTRLAEAIRDAIDHDNAELKLSQRDYGPIIRALEADPIFELEPVRNELLHELTMSMPKKRRSKRNAATS